MDLFDEEIVNLFRALYKFNVKYILVGGFATNLHGFNRTTGDIDIWIKDDLKNRKNFRNALKELEIGDFEEVEKMEFIPGWSSIYLNSGFELDVMTYISGFEKESFDTCFAMAPKAIILDIPVYFLHINQLISSKEKASRPKDLMDIAELKKIKAQQQPGKPI